MSVSSIDENSIPELRKSSPGVFEFGLGREPIPRRRFVAFWLIIGVAGLICSPGIGLSLYSGHWYGFSMFTGFYLLVCSLVFFTLFSSSAYTIDTSARSLTRLRFLWNWRFQTSTWILTDDDEFTVYLSRDEYGTSADHLVYLTRRGADHYLLNIKLPNVTESQDLLNWLDGLAKRLRIGNAGYGSTMTHLRRRLTPRQ